MWVYIQSSIDPPLWTVGFYSPTNQWMPDRDFPTQEEAARRAAPPPNGLTPR